MTRATDRAMGGATTTVMSLTHFAILCCLLFSQ
jgi:hypothetical protein